MLHLLEMPLVKRYIERNKQHKPQTIGDSVVLVADDDLTLEFNLSDNKLVVSDGWLTDWILLYDHTNQWVCDIGLATEPMRELLDNIALAHYNYINQ